MIVDVDSPLKLSDTWAAGDTDVTDIIADSLQPGRRTTIPEGTWLISHDELVLPDNSELHLSAGAKLLVKATDAGGYAAVSLADATNAHVTGLGEIDGGRDSHIGTEGEWGHCVDVRDSDKCSVRGITVSNAWGDGVYIGGDDGAIRDELGDVMFSCACIAVRRGIDPSEALRSTLARFESRFGHVERVLAERGRTPETSDIAEMDALWDDAKRIERAQSTD